MPARKGMEEVRSRIWCPSGSGQRLLKTVRYRVTGKAT
jgi:hypothetical protein